MKPSICVLAAGLLCSTSALAQTSVTVYGIVDAGLVHESGAAAGGTTKVSSGVASGSRLGFRGKEDLGNGMAAIFAIESGFNADTGTSGQGGVLFGRQAFVGLSGRFGSLTLGRQYTPYYKVLRDVGDPFGAVGLADRAGNLMALNTRTDNLVVYTGPAIAGFKADLAYGAGEVAGDSSKNRTLSGSLGYANGPLALQAAHHRIDNPAGTDAVTNTLLAASWKFARLSAYLSHAANKGPGAADSRDSLAGVSVPFGRHRFLLSHVRHEDRSARGADAHQWGAGYYYSLSKRTDLYAAYAVIRNRNGAAYTVGNATEKGSGDRAANLGIRHSF